MKHRCLIASLALFSLIGASASAKFAGKTEMNGISYKDYEGFEDKWKFVTVRYRMDSGEQRFTWGNDLAMKTLQSGKTDYPDGAVFAKIGFATDEDPAFTSSRVPSGSKRYQFMVRDRKKYADTGGWGYALFDGNKVTVEEDPKQRAQSCYACHRIVENRGQVFSQLVHIAPFVPKSLPDPAKHKEVDLNKVKFETVAVSRLPDLVKRSLPAGDKIRWITGDLRQHVFRGTIDEIRPTLIEETKKSNLPAALVSSDSDQFAVVYRDGARKNCAKEKSFKSVFSTSVPSSDPSSSAFTVVAWQDLCL